MKLQQKTQKELTKGCLQINETACNGADLTVFLLYNRYEYSYMKGGRGAKRV